LASIFLWPQGAFLFAAAARDAGHAPASEGPVWPVWAWIAFVAFILAMLAIDLGLLHKRAHEVKLKEALTWCAIWISLAFAFNILVWVLHGPTQALEFLTGYVIEYSLSVDNIFVFILIFNYFHVPPAYQHRVLFWGIIGALTMRAGMIAAGVALITAFHWIVYVFGAFLVFSGIKMISSKGKKFEPERNPLLKIIRRIVPLTDGFRGQAFFVRIAGGVYSTPLFIVLVLVEFTDLVFALDSIPAILAITKNAFIVFTSNVFAILGLRSLYFALAGVMNMFRYLHYGLSAVLIFVGVKMVMNGIVGEGFIPIGVSLGVVAALIAASVLASIYIPAKPTEGHGHGSV